MFQKGLGLEATVFGHFVPNTYNLFTSLTIVSKNLYQILKSWCKGVLANQASNFFQSCTHLSSSDHLHISLLDTLSSFPAHKNVYNIVSISCMTMFEVGMLINRCVKCVIFPMAVKCL